MCALVQGRRVVGTVLAALVMAALAGAPATGGGPMSSHARACDGTTSSQEVLDSWAKVRHTEVEMLRVTRSASGFTAAARVRRQGTALASVTATVDVCPDGVSNPVTATRRLKRSVSWRATVRNRTAATRARAEEQALHDAKVKARERMRKALVVAAMRQARDEAGDISISGRRGPTTTRLSR